MEQALAEVVGSLRTDPLLLYHVNALLHNPEWRAALKNSVTGPESGAQPEPQRSGRMLRAGIKKFSRLPRCGGGEHWQMPPDAQPRANQFFFRPRGV